MTTHTETDYTNFLKNHAHDKGNDFWAVRKEFPAFKAVRTYRAVDQHSLLVPPHAPITALKEVFRRHSLQCNRSNVAIVNLVIPKGAYLYFNPMAGGRKLRVNKARVHSVVRMHDKQPVAYGSSDFDSSFIYVNGEMAGRGPVEVVPNHFNMNPSTCTGGIHFFVDIERAKGYFI